MKLSANINQRLSDIIRRDKRSVPPTFLKVVTTDLDRLLNDYFDLSGESVVKVDMDDDGKYVIEISACARDVKAFASTVDLQRKPS